MNTRGTLLIISAGMLWGSMGLFVRQLYAVGFTPPQAAAMRLCIAGVAFTCILLIRQPRNALIRPRDIPLFLGLGLASILFFTVCYFTAIQIMSMSAAAILLYTSPLWVMLMSALFFREKLTAQKGVSLALAVTGCALVSGIASGDAALTPFGVAVGLGAGIGYALYSILGTIALRRYTPYAVTAYTFVIAGIGSLFVCDLPDAVATFSAAPNALALGGFILLYGIVTTVAPFLLYTLGLNDVSAGKAAILATTEPLVATLLGMAVFGEALTPFNAVGIACVIAAIVLLNIKTRKQNSAN